MTTSARPRPWWLWPLVIVVLPVAFVGVLVWLLVSVLLLAIVWLTWCTRRRYALVVYSNSPIWQEYFERRVLPDLRGRAVVLNWSERSRWTISLPVMLFRVFSGSRDFNPVGIVVAPFRWPRRFRFFGPFQSFKHGDPTAVDTMREEFFACLDEIAKPTA
jgi:hypothetical protein